MNPQDFLENKALIFGPPFLKHLTIFDLGKRVAVCPSPGKGLEEESSLRFSISSRPSLVVEGGKKIPLLVLQGYLSGKEFLISSFAPAIAIAAT